VRFTREEWEREGERERERVTEWESETKSKTEEFSIANNNDDNILLFLQHSNIMQANRWCMKGANCDTCAFWCCQTRTSLLKLALFTYRQLNQMLNILVLLDFVYSWKLNNMGFKRNTSGDEKLF
jgi:hypothetical protein